MRAASPLLDDVCHERLMAHCFVTRQWTGYARQSSLSCAMSATKLDVGLDGFLLDRQMTVIATTAPISDWECRAVWLVEP